MDAPPVTPAREAADASPRRPAATRSCLVRRAAVVAGVGGLVLGVAAGCGDEPPPWEPAGGASGGASASARAPSAETRDPGGSEPDEQRDAGTSNSDEPDFPADLKVLYRPQRASGRAAEALRDFGRFWRAWWYASATGGRDTGYRAYVAPGSFLGGTAIFGEVVDSWTRSRQRPTGTIRAYSVTATEGEDVPGTEEDESEWVYLDGCGDETKTGAKNVNTGQVDWSFGKSESSRYKFQVVLARAGGRWQIHEYRSFPGTDPAGRECRG